nr:ABC transporter ATP-binding protein [Catellatospora chokoriensis]
MRAAGVTFPGSPPVTALCPTDLVVRGGEYVTIVGPSGSGKSTLMNLLGLLDRPSEGTYLLDGMDTSALDEIERTALRARRIGFVFQTFHLLAHRTAVENVAMGMLYTGMRRAERAERAAAAVAQVGLSHRQDALPGTLSGGERQRVAIARALVARPSLLLCDEPTGNLDSVATRAVLELVDELRVDGLTVVLITHDPAVAARGDRTLTMNDGKLR